MSTIDFPDLSSATDHKLWPQIANKILLLASNQCPYLGIMGLVPEMISPAQLARRYDADTIDARTPVPPPGVEPGVATADQHRLHSKWVSDNDRYKKYLADKTQFFQAYASAVQNNPVVFMDMRNDTTGIIAHRTLLALHTAMETAYGTLTASDFRDLERDLNLVWNPSTQTLQQYVAALSDTFLSFSIANQPVAALQQWLRLNDGITKSTRAADFDTCIQLYCSNTPVLVNRTFSGLAKALIAHDKSLSNPTARQHGYAASVQPAPTPPVPPTELAQMQQMILSLQAQLNHPVAAATHAPVTGTVEAPKFCHTHGWVSHPGKGCENKLPGHDDNAPTNSVPLIVLQRRQNNKKKKHN
jgi:hypothetical protein